MITNKISVNGEVKFYEQLLALYTATQPNPEYKLTPRLIEFLALLLYHDIEDKSYEDLQTIFLEQHDMKKVTFRKWVTRLKKTKMIIEQSSADYDLNPQLSMIKNYVKKKQPNKFELRYILEIDYKNQ